MADSPPPTSPAAPASRRLLAAAGLLAGVSALYRLYRAFPDAYHNFDGLMFSAIITEDSTGWRAEIFQYAAHFLFNPTGWLFFKASRALGASLPGYELVQIMNALLACAAVSLAFLAFRRLTDDPWRALPLALLVAHSHHFWNRAAECSVYMPALFWVAATVAAIAWYHRTERTAALLAMAGSAGLAGLYHLSHVFWFPALAAYVALRRRKDLPLFLTFLAAVAGLPQILTFRILTPGALVNWYMRQGSGSVATWGRAPGLRGWGLHLPYQAKGLFQALWKWPDPGAPLWQWACLALAAAVLAALIVRGLRRFRPEEDRAARPLWVFTALFAAGVLFMLCFWALEMTKYSALIFAYALALSPLVRREEREPPSRAAVTRGLLFALWAVTGLYNLRAGAVPQSRLADNVDLQRALAIGNATEPHSIILLSGLDAPLFKVYLPLFPHRERLPLDLFLIGKPPDEGLKTYKTQVRVYIEHGYPIYAMSELVEGGAADAAPEEWALSREKIAGLLAPYEVREVARPTPADGVYRVWPRRATPRYWEHLGGLSMRAKHYPEAVHALERLLETAPDSRPGVLANLADAYLATGREADAVRLWREGLRRFPGDPLLTFQWALRLYRQGRAEEAGRLLARHLPPSEARRLERLLPGAPDAPPALAVTELD